MSWQTYGEQTGMTFGFHNYMLHTPPLENFKCSFPKCDVTDIQLVYVVDKGKPMHIGCSVKDLVAKELNTIFNGTTGMTLRAYLDAHRK